MKLFLKDHLLLTILYGIQLVLTLLIYWLDGNVRITTALYSILLSSVIYVVYLFYRYTTHRSFYKKLSYPPESLDDVGDKKAETPLSSAFYEFERKRLQQYQQNIHQYKHRLDHHITFMNQWVHHMKTPLSVIHLMMERRDDREALAIQDEVDRLKKGLDLVLYTSRLDAFTYDFHVEMLELNEFIRKVTSSQKRLFIRNRVYPHIDIKKNTWITSDEKWLSFALTQLITNAVRYSSEGSKLFFTSYNEKDYIALEVRDEGIGIPKEDLSRVFDPYFTGANGRKFQESTGMGLYLVKQIGEKLHHNITITSKVEEGTTVRLLFQKAAH
ncbi:sensor histidine kinase [Bacillus sp. JZ8]